MRIMPTSLLLLLLGLASCAQFDSAFHCASDSACTRMGRPGTCEPSGFCSFQDSSCASGRRFDEFAGDGLAGQCVGAALDGAADRATGPDAGIDAAPPDGPDPCAMVTCTGGTCVGGVCCQGCWSGTTCMPGTTTAACGFRGVACATCTTLQICSGVACAPCDNEPGGTVCRCGAPGMACCLNRICSAGANCVPGSLGDSCAACGGPGQSCCMFGQPCAPPVSCTLDNRCGLGG
ncbi:MAG TPA: hypothetical protein VKN99_23940 [Polyangia bacterium]|nr:hypothetical protein [Polyangia bacterium]